MVPGPFCSAHALRPAVLSGLLLFPMTRSVLDVEDWARYFVSGGVLGSSGARNVTSSGFTQ